MATADAIMYVGRSLVSMLDGGLAALLPTGHVMLSTPDDVKKKSPVTPAVTLILYHVGVCGEMRNARPGAAGRRPALPLDLRFLITPWAKEPTEAYQLIGAIAQYFHDHAVLAFGDLEGDGVWAPDDTVEVVMESLPVEEHYDIWAPTELPYRLSLAYLVRVVGIDPAAAPAAPPVVVAAAPGGAA